MKKSTYLCMAVLTLTLLTTSCREEKTPEEKVEAAIEDVKEDLEEASDDVKDAAEDLKDEIEEAAEEAEDDN